MKYGSARLKAAKVIGPFGPLTIDDLPSSKTKRWSIRRKAEVVTAVRGGLLSLEEACSRYALNVEEFRAWEYCIDRYGLAGLRATRTQFYPTNVKRQRRLVRFSPNWLANDGECGRGAAPSPIPQPLSGTECGKQFSVPGIGSALMECGSIGLCNDSSDGASIDTFSMNGECRCDFNIAWFGMRTIVCERCSSSAISGHFGGGTAVG